MADEIVSPNDKWLCERLTGLRKAVELILEKLGIKFCYACHREVDKIYEIETVDILGNKRKIKLCKECYKKYGMKLASRN